MKDALILTRISELKAEIVRAGDAVLSRAESDTSRPLLPFVRQAVQDRAYRLSVVQDVIDRIRMVLDARAAENRGGPCGAASGVMVSRIRMIGKGKEAREVVEYTADTALLGELREQLKHGAMESGDWDEKQIKPPAAMDDETRSMSTDELYARQAILLDAKAKLDALRSGKSVETQRVIESSPLDVVIDTGAVATVDDGLQDGSIGDSGLAGAENIGGPL